MTNTQAKKELRDKGWGYLRAAEAMGYSFSHIAKSLAGERPVSRVMASRIRALPQSPKPYRLSGFALSRPRK